jgi:hypothetical protein
VRKVLKVLMVLKVLKVLGVLSVRRICQNSNPKELEHFQARENPEHLENPENL